MSTPGAPARAPRAVRALRGSTDAACAVLIAGTAHTLSGGGAPPAWLMLAVTILAAPLCTLLVGRRPSRWRLAAAVAAAQLALHATFAAVGGAGPIGAAHDAAAMHGVHAMHADLLTLLAPAAGGVDPAAAVMTLGHVLAAAITFAALAWGERMLAALARGIRRVLRPPYAPRPARPTSPRAAFLPRRGPAPAFFLHCVTRRGPPARRALAAAV